MYPETKLGQYIKELHNSKYPFVHRCQLEERKTVEKDAPFFKRFFYKLYVYLVLLPHYNHNTEFYYDSLDSVDKTRESHMRNYPYMLHPFCRFRTFFDTFLTLPYLLIEIYLGTIPAFPLTLNRNFYEVLAFILLILGTSFLLLNFITGYSVRNDRKVVMDPKKVVVRYLKRYFIVDLGLVLPHYIELIFSHAMSYSKHLNLFYLVSFLRVSTVVELFQNICSRLTDNSRLVNRIVLALKIWLSLHMIACITVVIRNDADDESDQHIDETPSQLSIYFVELYKIVNQINNISLMSEASSIDMSFVLFVRVLISVVLFAYVLASILMESFAEVSQETLYNRLASQVRNFARQGHRDPAVRERIVRMFDVIFTGSYLSEKRVKETVPDNLKRDLDSETLGGLLRGTKKLSGLDQYLLYRLYDRMNLVVLLPDDHLVTQGQAADSMFFLSAGRLILYRHDQEIGHLDDGDNLAEDAIFSEDVVYTETVIAGTACFLYKLSRKDFQISLIV